MLTQRRDPVAHRLVHDTRAWHSPPRLRSSPGGRGRPALYASAALTLVLKVVLLPWLLYRLIRRLDVRWDVEGLINIPTTMLIGIVLVVFSFNLAIRSRSWRAPSRALPRDRDGMRLAVVPHDDHAPQGSSPGHRLPVDGERPVLRGVHSATYGMPMVVKLGIALDVLVGMLILGVFFFQIREQFDSLDLKHLEKLKESE